MADLGESEPDRLRNCVSVTVLCRPKRRETGTLALFLLNEPFYHQLVVRFQLWGRISSMLTVKPKSSDIFYLGI